MISSTVLITKSFYYPLGNTPPVSLAQDLPPEQDADILLLGCGDARNILFSCFVDNARRMDVTCCDIEPGIQARNVLLYSLLIDDKLNLNVDRIWNIYYHWSLDDDSVELLGTQIEKLLQHSKSIDEWHNSVYGSTIRFCDETSLSRVRDYWLHFSSKSLTPSEENHRVGKLKAARERALAYRNQRMKGNIDVTSPLRSTLPVLNTDCCFDFSEVYNHWWAKGTVPMSAELAQKMVHLNPTFFYSQTEVLILHYGTSPLLGFPLSTAQAPISEGSAFHLPKRGLSSIDHLVECAKRHFTVWALSFRIAAANKLIIRIFTGDALAFCFALCCHKQSVAAGRKDNWFHTNFNCSIINLHVDQDSKVKPAPVNFDVIDTSNIADTLGALNLMSLGSILLKHHASSSLYTETLLQYHSSIVGRFSNMLCADVRTMPLLLGFVLPDLYTNATNSVEEDYVMGRLRKGSGELVTNKRSRLRWKRSAGFQDANNTAFGQIEVEAKALAKFLVAVHNEMFKYDDIARWSSFKKRGTSNFWREVIMSGTFARYNRASFAFLLTALKCNVISDWDLCVECIYREIFSSHPLESLMTNSAQDLILNMHLFGVDNGRFIKPSSRDVKDAVLAPILPLNEGLPDQLCVTIRVSRMDLNKTILKKSLEELGCRALVVNFEGSEPGHVHWVNFFSAVQIMFGKWCKAGEENNSYPFIEEDSAQLPGSSDMYVSVLVPTFMLLYSKSKVPLVKVGFLLHAANQLDLGEELGPTLCFASRKMTSEDVFITRYMPGTSSLPNFVFVTNSKESKANSNVTTLRLSDDGLKVESLTRRVSLQNDSIGKAKLALRTSEVKINFKSPFLAVANIAKSLNIELNFPVPVSMSKFRVRIARKSSYIEVETPLLNADEADAANFMFPLFVAKVPSGLKIPMPWSAMRINLDAMPPLDVSNKESISWMIYFFSGMLPHPKKQLRESDATYDVRSRLKKLLLGLFVHFVGLDDVEVQTIFGLSTQNLGIQTLIFASNLRLDLANLSVVLDAAVIPLSHEMLGTEEMTKFLSQLSSSGLLRILSISDEQNVSWKVLLPAMVERCRASNTWKHTPRCEYLKVGEIPLPVGLDEVGKSSICSCGIGKCFPANYLKESKNKFSELDTILNLHATRAAIGPIFAVPYVEETFGFFGNSEFNQPVVKEKCENCGKSEKEISPGGPTEETLKKCSKCRAVKYCSRECQKTDWSKHKPVCKGN
nr:PREDICTED: uncharacterized protein LOC109035832 isoform X2 [Bemisia tabaci]